jgi:hypothetical protein
MLRAIPDVLGLNCQQTQVLSRELNRGKGVGVGLVVVGVGEDAS